MFAQALRSTLRSVLHRSPSPRRLGVVEPLEKAQKQSKTKFGCNFDLPAGELYVNFKFFFFFF